MTTTTDMSAVIENRIGNILEEKGISSKWLAKQVGLSANMISGYVTNKNQPSLANAYKIANVLGVQMESLVVVND